MRMRTPASLVMLFLFSVITVPTLGAQTMGKANRPHESFASDKERAPSQEKTKDEWSRREPPREGEEWFSRGYQMHSADRYPEAIEAFKRAADLGYRKATAMYNIACGYSLLNDKDNALAWLQRALDNGFDGFNLIADDSDLDPIRADVRFKKIVAGIPAESENKRSRNGRDRVKLDRLEQANLDFARLEGEVSREGEEWAKVGSRLLMLRDLDRSVVALNRAVTLLDYEGSSAMYNLACAYSLKGDRDSGIKWLEKSINAGFDSPDKLRNDPDINNLRGDSRFSRINKLSNTLSLSQFNGNRDRFRDSGNSNYSKERWAPAIALYESFVKSEPNNGRGWFNLGYALHYSHEHTKAIEAFELALSLGYHKPVSTYNIACAYAMLNQRDAAFTWLDRAIEAGFDSYGSLSQDRDLDSLRSDPRFRPFLDRANYNTRVRTKKYERNEW
jgi:tetratricopeptide (TPR) repeat protein